MNQRSSVLVLKNVRFGEADLIVHTLTDRGGRLDFLARSALKSRKRFGGGVLQPTHLIETNYRIKSNSNSDLITLEDARLIDGFEGLRTDYRKLELSFHFLKLILKVTRQGVEDSPEIFDLIIEALRQLETGANIESLKTLFELRLLSLQGVLTPDLQISELLNGDMAQAAALIANLNTQVSQRLGQVLNRYIG